MRHRITPLVSLQCFAWTRLTLRSNNADSNLPALPVAIFETRLFRQFFVLQRFRQNDEFGTLVFEQQPSHGCFHDVSKCRAETGCFICSGTRVRIADPRLTMHFHVKLEVPNVPLADHFRPVADSSRRLSRGKRRVLPI